MTPKPGESIGPFTLVKLLGQGGMGAVFLARHANGTEVALKVLLDSTPSILERFRRELAVMGRVDRHPGIVRVHTAGTSERGVPYVVMELVKGGDLAKAIGGRPMEPLRAAALVEKVARAVEHCHALGVIHRDLKPANVLIRSEDQEPLVTDFGLARDDSSERLTKTGELLGTPAYMAPEQLGEEHAAIERRTDVYSLGAILYECLTGGPPFKSDSQPSLLRMVLMDDATDPRRRVPAIPADLAVIALKCLEKERARRYPTALELAEDLGRVQRGEPIAARPIGALERLRRRARRHRALVGIGTVFAIALAVLAPLVVRHLVALDEKKIGEALPAAIEHARGEGFPALLARAPGPALRAELDSLTRLGGYAEVSTAQALVRWARLTGGDADRATLAEPPALPSGLTDALDGAAAVRLRDAGVIAEVASRLFDGRGANMLRAWREPRLLKVLDAFDALTPDERAAWAAGFVEAVALALRATCEDPAAPPPGEELRRVVAFATGRFRELPRAIDAALPEEGWIKVSERRPLDAAELAALASTSVTRRQGLARDLSRRALALMPKKLSFRDALDRLLAIGRLGARPTADVLERLAGEHSGDPETLLPATRFERFAALLAVGQSPSPEDLRPSRKSQSAESRRAFAESIRAESIQFVARFGQEPVVRLAAAVGRFAVGVELRSYDGARDREAGDAEVRTATAMLDAVRPELSGHLRTYETFVRAFYAAHSDLNASGKPELPTQFDHDQNAGTRALLDAVGADFPRPWYLIQLRVGTQLKDLALLCGAVKAAKDAGKSDDIAPGLERIEALVASVLETTRRWETLFESARREVEELTDITPRTDEQSSRMTELMIVAGFGKSDKLGLDYVQDRANTHEIVMKLYEQIGDKEGCARHASAAAAHVAVIVERAPDKVKSRRDLAHLLVLANRIAEARIEYQRCLRFTDTNVGGLTKAECEEIEGLLKNLK